MNKKLFLGVIIIFIIFIIIYGFISNKSFVINKQDNSKDIIYEKLNDKNKHIPFINLVGEDIDKVNDNIDLFVNYYLNDESVNIDYDYNKNGNILSILVRIIDPKTADSPEIKFTSYNIILNNSSLISDDELFSIFNSNSDEINKIIENSFIDFYNNNEINKSISYNDYLKYRNNYFNYNKDISYYIDKGKIYGYLNINSGIDYSEYDYFMNKDFRVLVGDINAK